MSAPRIELRGLLGDALDANLRGRLLHFITGPGSPAIALFSDAHRAHNHEGDWYGEHAGKWLVAAAKAVARSSDAQLRAHLVAVADYLVNQQLDDGYLGTYADERRFMHPQPPKPRTWDGAPALRTWDVWVHAYLILGFVETYRVLGDARHLDAARRIGDLCARVLASGIDICTLGNHHGLSATVLMDAAMELHAVTGEARHLALAQRVLAQADANPDLALLTKALAGADAADIATGKAYQLLWNLVGLAKLHRATGDAAYRIAVDRLWQSVRDHHLSLGGGPWGGVAHRSREVFNAPHAFSPEGYVETCSTLAWIQLNRELLGISDDPKYADEIERSAYNDLLGAQAPDGEDWCYYVFANGRRVHTTYWRCCKSSGAMALEELPALAYTQRDDTLTVNLYGPGRATLALADGAPVTLEQHTNYPANGAIRVVLGLTRPRRFALRMRIPAWAGEARVRIGDAAATAVACGRYETIDREWRDGDTVELALPMRAILHRRLNRNVQESRAPDGSAVHQEVLHREYVAITRGPLAYATGLIDGFKAEETVRLPADADACLGETPDANGEARVTLDLGYRAPIAFAPYYRAGGRVDGAWRLTWLPLAPDASVA